jgi:hypothetical protein
VGPGDGRKQVSPLTTMAAEYPDRFSGRACRKETVQRKQQNDQLKQDASPLTAYFLSFRTVGVWVLTAPRVRGGPEAAKTPGGPQVPQRGVGSEWAGPSRLDLSHKR